jgi:hypothetical protein
VRKRPAHGDRQRADADADVQKRCARLLEARGEVAERGISFSFSTAANMLEPAPCACRMTGSVWRQREVGPPSTAARRYAAGCSRYDR